MKNELLRLSADRFVALILDNEVTVGEFVATPPLSWTRLVQRNGFFQIAEGYPNLLTAIADSPARFDLTSPLPLVLSAYARRRQIQGQRGPPLD